MSHQHELVKRFVAPTMRRALDMVQQELGPEAVILSSKKVAKGVEVVTSLEPDLPTRGIDVRREFGQKFDAEYDRALPSDTAWRSQAGIEKASASFAGRMEDNGANASLPRRSPEELAVEIERARERMLEAKRSAKLAEEGGRELGSSYAPSENSTPEGYRPPASETAREGFGRPAGLERKLAPVAAGTQPDYVAQPEVSVVEQQRLDSLQSELADMRMLLEQQLWQMRDTQPQGTFSGSHGQINMPQNFGLVNSHLARLGLSEGLVSELACQVNPGEKANVAWRKCMAQLAHRLPILGDDVIENGGVFALVGQTGVGKTTTIAKLAAQYVLRHGPGKVALVTTDTYRVGAYEQLRSMGRILNVPVKVVDGQNSLHTVLSSLKEFPLILIDTAGFRHGDPLLKAQLEQLDTCARVKRILVMSCNSQQQTMKASVHAYASKRGVHACVLTKLDESASIGEALSVVIDKNLPVAYVTDGQEIPKDISPASGHSLVAKAVAIAKEASVDGSGALSGGAS